MTIQLDRQLYTIFCHVSPNRNAGWYAVDRMDIDMTRQATIRDIGNGEYTNVAAVIAFNPSEHTADDVTEEIAIEIANGLDASEPITAELFDFIETHAGLDYARGLRVADRTLSGT
jgi:hypothetical protein